MRPSQESGMPLQESQTFPAQRSSPAQGGMTLSLRVQHLPETAQASPHGPPSGLAQELTSAIRLLHQWPVQHVGECERSANHHNPECVDPHVLGFETLTPGYLWLIIHCLWSQYTQTALTSLPGNRLKDPPAMTPCWFSVVTSHWEHRDLPGKPFCKGP